MRPISASLADRERVGERTVLIGRWSVEVVAWRGPPVLEDGAPIGLKEGPLLLKSLLSCLVYLGCDVGQSHSKCLGIIFHTYTKTTGINAGFHC